ncbi:pyridoxal phosphate-dependent decarboxylase family protein [Phytoactinopolyspora endophytica]|uniref:pyridoxal phosphate-dependent decarboxylase family protein n=1 Tax=Phytoactinopolyspora endophytica TaxID=1642495 RepID=UPI00101DD392|nr:aminotransferase class V-fold PLP-dependent enzyme [Phytoactinopolyspora endophytica]
MGDTQPKVPVEAGDATHGSAFDGPLGEAYRQALTHLAGLSHRPVGVRATPAQLREALAGPLPEEPSDPQHVVTALVEACEPGVVATAGGRFFGFVIGGATPAALAADWMTSAWDQNAAMYAAAPAAAVVEEVAGTWAAQLLGLPSEASAGFVTGGQMANFAGLAAARHEVLQRAGWNVETEGLAGAPPIRIMASDGRHETIDRALRFLGLGTSAVTSVPTDAQGRMDHAALGRMLAGERGPLIVCAQVGNVNSGAIDQVGEICQIAHDAGAWVHVDGAFGLWASASPRLRSLVAGVELADSWAVDCHKWLNVPYDSGLVFCAHPEAHSAAMGIRAAYLPHGAGSTRDSLDFNPELSRRARGFAVYAAIAALGRQGIADLVERCCHHARTFADRLSAHERVEVLNDVVLNQVLVRFLAADGDHDGYTRSVLRRVQEEGTSWMGGTTWRGQAAMRISVSSWVTDEADVDRTVQAVLQCAAAADHDRPQ